MLSAEVEDGGSIRFGDAQDLAYDADFFPGAQHDASITTPDALLGQRHGSRLAHHSEVLGAFRLWAEQSDRMKIETFGKTHEGRELVYAVITSPANHGRLDQLMADHAKLAAGSLSENAAAEMARTAPAVAWMGYSIHGDELSGTDAALAVAHHLVADQSEGTLSMLDELVIVVDPCLNPDGRERIIGMVEQSAGYTPNLNYSSMHRGRWPFGRGNHYLFDMNRDWMAGTQPETRARWQAIQDWNPQLFVDAHEMGALDTFLFYPQAAPINVHMPEKHLHWQSLFAGDAARAFDREGWAYYTREWADGWAPFYSDAWASLMGAVGILYEQAGVAGFQLRRASGEILTYREAVHHQVQASFANLHTLQAHREPILVDYAANKRKNVDPSTEGNDEWFAVVPGNDASRWRELLRVLDGQGIEYYHSDEALELREASGSRGASEDTVALPAESLLVPAMQAKRQLVRAFFEFDPRIDSETLVKEREELERKNSSKMYDMTAWSLPHAYDLDGWWGKLDVTTDDLKVGMTSRENGGLFGSVAEGQEVYAWIVDGHDDAAVAFAARAMEAGLQVNVSDREFETGSKSWSRGSLLVRRNEQAFDTAECERRLTRAAMASLAAVERISSGRAPGDGPDLGGGHFKLLARPRIALLSNSPVRSDVYGHLWHHLDVRLGVPFTIIDAQQFGGADLRRYNVLVIPPGGVRSILADNKSAIETWIRGGGTLVATGSASSSLTAGALGFSSVSLRRDALEELDVYERAVAKERAAWNIEVDEELVWNGKSAEEDAAPADEDGAETSDIPIEERDAWMRRFSPSGVNLLGQVNTDHWLTAGCNEVMPIGISGSSVFLSKGHIETPVRFAPADELRLSGLLWPEARERIAGSAYVTRERKGNGQVILFAGVPALRGYHLATGRLLANAVIYGPGLGASQPIGW